MSLKKALYRAHAHVTGGRDGRAVVPAGNLDFKLIPLGNWALRAAKAPIPSSFLRPATLPGSSVRRSSWPRATRSPTLRKSRLTAASARRPNGFGIEVKLKISLPGMAREAAQTLVHKAHVVCPYSNATRGNIEVTLTIV
jgi:osmotically inducible protein OsmC